MRGRINRKNCAWQFKLLWVEPSPATRDNRTHTCGLNRIQDNLSETNWITAEDTAEASGLNGTFEQLGNAVGVALVGTIMLGGLIAGVQDNIYDSSAVPEQHKAALIEAAESSVYLMSNTELENELNNIGASAAVKSEALSIYSLARTQAFQAGLSFLIFISLLGLVKTTMLPKRKLVEA